MKVFFLIALNILFAFKIPLKINHQSLNNTIEKDQEPSRQETIEWLRDKYSKYANKYAAPEKFLNGDINYNYVYKIEFAETGIYITSAFFLSFPTEDEIENSTPECKFVPYEILKGVSRTTKDDIMLLLTDNFNNCDGTRYKEYWSYVHCPIKGDSEPDLTSRILKAFNNLIKLTPKRKSQEIF